MDKKKARKRAATATDALPMTDSTEELTKCLETAFRVDTNTSRSSKLKNTLDLKDGATAPFEKRRTKEAQDMQALLTDMHQDGSQSARGRRVTYAVPVNDPSRVPCRSRSLTFNGENIPAPCTATAASSASSSAPRQSASFGRLSTSAGNDADLDARIALLGHPPLSSSVGSSPTFSPTHQQQQQQRRKTPTAHSSSSAPSSPAMASLLPSLGPTPRSHSTAPTPALSSSASLPPSPIAAFGGKLSNSSPGHHAPLALSPRSRRVFQDLTISINLPKPPPLSLTLTMSDGSRSGSEAKRPHGLTRPSSVEADDTDSLQRSLSEDEETKFTSLAQPLRVLMDRFLMKDVMTNAKVMVLRSNLTIPKALQILFEHKYLSAPLQSYKTGIVIRIIGVIDFVSIVLKLLKNGTKKKPAAAAFATTRLHDCLDLSPNADPWVSIRETDKLRKTVLALSMGTKRVMITNDKGKDLVGVYGQMDLLRLIASRGAFFGARRTHLLRDVNFYRPRSRTITVHEEVATWTAYDVLVKSSVAAVGVVDRKGKLLGEVGAHHLRALNEENFDSLLKPVNQFVEMIDKLGRDTMARTTLDVSLAHLVNLFCVHQVHRVWIVDTEGTLVGVASLTDIIRYLTQFDVSQPDNDGLMFKLDT